MFRISHVFKRSLILTLRLQLNVFCISVCSCWRCFKLPLHVFKHVLFLTVALVLMSNTVMRGPIRFIQPTFYWLFSLKQAWRTFFLWPESCLLGHKLHGRASTFSKRFFPQLIQFSWFVPLMTLEIFSSPQANLGTLVLLLLRKTSLRMCNTPHLLLSSCLSA